jgi:site-specific DNA-methyltransferase (adenine-specific)
MASRASGETADALTIANDAMEGEEYRRFLAAALSNSAGTPARRAFYIWHADTADLATRWACSEAGLTVRQCLVWTKNTMVLSRQDYQWKHEPCLHTPCYLRAVSLMPRPAFGLDTIHTPGG